jgi:cyclophilin family peptidyl-prolyl cis-trans isomerase
MPTKPGTYATFKTSEGTVVCELFEKDAPETVANFIALAEGTKEWNSRSKKGAKLYDGTIFHRVIPQFMIQGGDPEGTGMGGPGYKFADETKGSKHGQRRTQHQRQPVLHHRRRHQLADRQAHHLRRSSRRLRRSRKNQQS